MSKIYFSFNDILLIFISFFFPPISVFLKTGCNKDLVINLLLTTFTFLFGVFHAIYVIAKSTNDEYDTLNDQSNDNGNYPDNAIVVILPGANNNNTVPTNLPPPSYAESEQIAKEQKQFLYPELPSYDATTSRDNEKH